MKAFMDEDFLLRNKKAQTLYHNYASQMPIIDYHCHIDPKEIAQDLNYSNITELWLGHDHYKWRLMRLNGISEDLITGEASDYDKFEAWARTLEGAVGNPLYHWSHLELQRYFNCDRELNQTSAHEIFDLCNEKIQTGELSAKNIIRKSNVTCIGTTDDPVDELIWHKQIAEDPGFDTRVVPTFRPDQAFTIGDKGFCDWVDKLGTSANMQVVDYDSFLKALKNRMDYFNEMGCLSSDHSFEEVPFERTDYNRIRRIFDAGLNHETITNLEKRQFITETMLFLAKEYASRNWVMQLHFGVKRNTNKKMFENLGKDTGFDRIATATGLETLSMFLDALDYENKLPKTILYSLNPVDNAALDVLCGCFCEKGVRNKVTHGAAWWFNDHLGGIQDYLEDMSYRGLLSGCIGMLTDSRSLLSYTRHEYFRRILCNYIGTLAETGMLYWDEERLGHMVMDISYNNTRDYFGF